MTVERYRFVLTGAPDSLPDLELSIASFQARYSAGGERFVSVVVPNVSLFATEINLRPNGDLQVYRTVDGAESLYTDANFNQILITDSALKTTAQLNGTRQETNTTPVTIPLDVVTTRTQQSDGQTRFRVPMRPIIRPGDSVTDQAVTYLVNNASVVVNATLGYMELAGG